MIYTDCTITVTNDKSKSNRDIILYRGDKEIEIRFTIMQNPFYQRVLSNQGTNLIETTDCSYAQLVIKQPNGTNIFSEITTVDEKAVTLKITKSMIDETEELGEYDFQIRLFDESRKSRVTIPPIEKGIIIKEPIAIEDTEIENTPIEEEEALEVFDEAGKYNITVWTENSKVTTAKMNKIEDALYEINEIAREIDGIGITDEQLEQLTIAYEHSQTDHVSEDDIPKRVSQLTNDSNYVTKTYVDEQISNIEINQEDIDLTDYAKKTDIPTKVSQLANDEQFASKSYVSVEITKAQLGVENGEINLDGFATKDDIPKRTSQLTNDSGFLTSIPSEYVTESELNAKGYLTQHQSLADYAKKTDIPSVPTKTSELTNDKGYITSIPSEYVTESELEDKNYASKTYVDEAVANVDVSDIDLSIYATKDNPTFTNSISMGRHNAVGKTGENSVALGQGVVAQGNYSFASGYYTTASGLYSNVEGNNTIASGQSAHAQGDTTIASGQSAHAQGCNTTASAMASHAEGYHTIASSRYQHVQGKFNIDDASGKYAHIVGNGTEDYENGTYIQHRSNAHTLDWQGNAWYAGNVSVDGTPASDKDLTTKKYVDDAVANIKINDIDLSSYAKKTDIPTVTNDLTNALKSNYDKAYTHSQSTHAPSNAQKNSDITKAEIEAKLTGNITTHTHSYATENYVDTKITALVNSAPETMNTFKELADAIEQHEDVYEAYVQEVSIQLANKAEKEHTHSQYLTQHQSLADYAKKTDIPTVVSAFTNDKDYVTQEYVDEAIANAELGGEEVDLSNYITKDDITVIGDINSEEIHILKASEIEADISKLVLFNNVQIADIILINEIVQIDTWLNEDDKKGITITSLYGYCNDFIENDNDEFDIQFENSYAWQSDLSDNYVTKEELNEAISNIEIDVDLSEYAKKEQFTTVENNTLTTDKYQYINITTDTIINLPSVTEFTEIHLYFNTADDFASAITLSATAQIRYQAELSFEASNCYEIIATYVPNCSWLVGAVKYEGLVSQASGGAVNPPNVVDPF